MSRAASDTPGTRATAGSTVPAAAALTHLQRLEAESIHILREVVAESERPVHAVLHRQGQREVELLAPRREGVLSGAAAVSAAARRH